MKNFGFATLLATSVLMVGCSQGDNKGFTTLNNGDFSVSNPPDNSSSSDSSSPDSSVQPSPTTPTAPTLEGFVINKGEGLVTSNVLNLQFLPPFSSAYVKVSEAENCASGTWGSYSDSKSYTSSKTNQLVSLSVQFRDYDNRVSSCYTQKVVIDQAGPEIVFGRYPTGVVEEGQSVEIVFTVIDPASGVADVTCQVGSVVKPCRAGENTLLFPQLAQGDYTLKVSAKDKVGFSSEKSLTFKVSTSYRRMSQVLKVTESNKVDILFVIDNSGSMQYEQQSMASRVRNFLDVVKGLDWQIAVTTTDPTSANLGDGRLIPMTGASSAFYILNSSMDDSFARNTLGSTLQRKEIGSSSEQGIYAAYRAVERSLAASGGNAQFIRENSQLAVVLISDEDESASGPKNDPANFLKFIQTSFASQKAMSFHSIIARPGDQVCLKGEGASAGYRYEQMSKLTGGVIGDVCAMDYGAQLTGIAEGVRKTMKSVSLSCAPIEDGSHSILVTKDGQPYGGTRKVEGLNLVFDQMLPAGSYEVAYSCLK